MFPCICFYLNKSQLVLKLNLYSKVLIFFLFRTPHTIIDKIILGNLNVQLTWHFNIWINCVLYIFQTHLYCFLKASSTPRTASGEALPVGLPRKGSEGISFLPQLWLQNCNHNMFLMPWCKRGFRAQQSHVIWSKGLEYLRPYLINRERKAVFLFQLSMSWKKEIIIQEIEVYELENMNLIF